MGIEPSRTCDRLVFGICGGKQIDPFIKPPACPQDHGKQATFWAIAGDQIDRSGPQRQRKQSDILEPIDHQLELKHGDRPEIARPAALWMARAGHSILQPDMLIVPVPLHWTRLLKRRYNQSALLAQALSQETGLSHCPDLLLRAKRTAMLDGKSLQQRFADLSGAIAVHTKRRHRIAGRRVLLVDDVMTTGATLGACAQACLNAGAADVCTLTLARVAKDA